MSRILARKKATGGSTVDPPVAFLLLTTTRGPIAFGDRNNGCLTFGARNLSFPALFLRTKPFARGDGVGLLGISLRGGGARGAVQNYAQKSYLARKAARGKVARRKLRAKRLRAERLRAGKLHRAKSDRTRVRACISCIFVIFCAQPFLRAAFLRATFPARRFPSAQPFRAHLLRTMLCVAFRRTLKRFPRVPDPLSRAPVETFFEKVSTGARFPRVPDGRRIPGNGFHGCPLRQVSTSGFRRSLI